MLVFGSLCYGFRRVGCLWTPLVRRHLPDLLASRLLAPSAARNGFLDTAGASESEDESSSDEALAAPRPLDGRSGSSLRPWTA